MSREQEFNEILEKANEAAESASRRWLEEAQQRGPMYTVMSGGVAVGELLDLCGGAYIKMTDLRKPFVKHLVKLKMREYEESGQRWFGIESAGRYWSLRYSLHCRQEYGLHQAAARAFFDTLSQYGCSDGLAIHSYVD